MYRDGVEWSFTASGVCGELECRGYDGEPGRILVLPAGVGKATAHSCIKLQLGIRPSRSGVYSAGNGPAMRAPLLGATMDDVSQLLEFVRASSLIIKFISDWQVPPIS
jgi:hypothetical protein